MKSHSLMLLAVTALTSVLPCQANEKGLILTGRMDPRLKIEVKITLEATYTWNPFCMHRSELGAILLGTPCFLPNLVTKTILIEPSGDDNQYHLNIDYSKLRGGCGYAKPSSKYQSYVPDPI